MTPVCSVSWCIGVPNPGSTKCPIHRETPSYKPTPWPKQKSDYDTLPRAKW